MTAFNVVRFRAKPGSEEKLVALHRGLPAIKGMVRGNLIKTGDRDFCMVGEWRDMESLAAARPAMIAILDTLRELLEDLGDDRGVTDPVSGDVVVTVAAPKPKKKPKSKPKKAAKKKQGKKKKTTAKKKGGRKKAKGKKKRK